MKQKTEEQMANDILSVMDWKAKRKFHKDNIWYRGAVKIMCMNTGVNFKNVLNLVHLKLNPIITVLTLQNN